MWVAAERPEHPEQWVRLRGLQLFSVDGGRLRECLRLRAAVRLLQEHQARRVIPA
jgi:hypothetical protein